MGAPPIQPASEVAELWEEYGGETKWSKTLREFGALGGLVQYWSGMPQSASAIPLTFALFAPDGTKLASNYRLKDIRAAIETVRTRT